jgi:hypothetical protein
MSTRFCGYLIFAIALGFSFSIFPANAQPAGSWQASCPGFSVDAKARMLYATCTDKQGNPRATRIFYLDCIGDIYNFDGHLDCTHKFPVPQGSYHSTCGFAFTRPLVGGKIPKGSFFPFTGSILYASCQHGLSWDDPQFLVDTQLKSPFSCQDVANINGKLVCQK